MRFRTLAAALVCAALAVPAAAQAKGATAATIEGDGLDGGAITFRSETGGDPVAGTPLARLAEASGFYPAVFGQTPNPLLPGRPEGDLGPRYTVRYTMPGPDDQVDTLRQELYPYAAGGMVTYTPPGQRFFGSETTRGGWFRAYTDLKAMLVEAGLPASPGTGTSGGGAAVTWPAAGAVLLAGLLGGVLVLVARRRPGALAAR
jgi:hypothetical protein